MNFGSQDNLVIRGIVLIGDWFSTKTRKIDKLDFQSPLFYIKQKKFSWKTLLFYSETILNALWYYWVKIILCLSPKKLIFTCVRIMFYERKNKLLWHYSSCNGTYISIFWKIMLNQAFFFWKIVLNRGIVLFSTIFISC